MSQVEDLSKLAQSQRELGRQGQIRGRLEAAYGHFEAELQLAEQIRSLVGDTPEALRDVMIGFGDLGDVALELGHLGEAQVRYEAMLKLAEQACQIAGNTPETLIDISASLDCLGRMAEARGNLNEAQSRYEAALQLAEQARRLLGNAPEALRKMSISLGRLAEVARVQERHDQAQSCFEAKLQLDEQIHSLLGETPEVLRDLSISWVGLADTAVARSRPEEAQERLQTALQMQEKVRSVLGDTPATMGDVGLILGRLGDIARYLGRLGEAQAHYEAKLKLAEQIRCLMGNTPFAMREVCSSLRGIALGLLEVGRLDEAQGHCESLLRLAEQMRGLVGNTPAALVEVITGHQLLSYLASMRGRVDAEQQWREQSLSLTEQLRRVAGETPMVLRMVVHSLWHQAWTAIELGRLDDAEVLLASSLELARQIRRLVGDTFVSQFLVIVSLGQLADLMVMTDRLDEAYEHFEAGLQLGAEFRRICGDTPESLRCVATLIGGLARACAVRENFGEAQVHLGHKLQLDEQILQLEGDTPFALRSVSEDHRMLGTIAGANGDNLHAGRHYLQAVKTGLVALVPGSEESLKDVCESSVALPLVFLLDLIDKSELRSLYKRMVSFVSSYAEFNDPQSLERARPHIERFHSTWLCMALESSPEWLPAILGAAQGRKVMTLAMHEFHRQANFGAVQSVPQFARYLAALARVNHLALALGGGARAGSAFGDLPGMTSEHKVESAEAIRARTQCLWAEHRAALAEHEAARAALIDVRPELADLTLARADGYTLESLQQGLTPDSALLLLLMAPVDYKVDQPKHLHRAHALLIRKEGPPRLWALPELDCLPGQIHAWRQAQASGQRTMEGASTYRDCLGWPRGQDAGADADADATLPAPEHIDTEQALRQRLWSVLQNPDGRDGPSSCLAGITLLHVVSHGQLHGLPLALGAPQGIAISQYPGLVNYWLVAQDSQQTALAMNSLQRLQLQVYSPEAGTGEQEALGRIPYVQAEAHLVGRCWARHDELLQRGPLNAPATVLHLACHGTLQRQGQEDPCLILSPKDSVNLIELLQGAPSAPIVYLSACLVGRTREDGDGDPLGLVSGFFLRGARCVIAALNPISDFHAPLLAYLFHRSLQAQAQYQGQLRPVQALADAKRQLQSGRWVPEQVPPDEQGQWEHNSVLAVQQAYGAQIQNELRQDVDKLPFEDWGGQIRERMIQWGMGQLLGGEVGRLSRDMRDALKANQKGEKVAGLLLAQRLVQERMQLYKALTPLQWLLQDVQAFGAVRGSR